MNKYRITYMGKDGYQCDTVIEANNEWEAVYKDAYNDAKNEDGINYLENGYSIKSVKPV